MKQQKQYHRNILEIITDIMRTVGRQRLAFRGHEKDSEDHNGRQMVNLVVCHSAIMQKWTY